MSTATLAPEPSLAQFPGERPTTTCQTCGLPLVRLLGGPWVHCDTFQAGAFLDHAAAPARQRHRTTPSYRSWSQRSSEAAAARSAAARKAWETRRARAAEARR